MGIFDDAIREHLELKRHSGADEEKLQELEDEAFGPPARPGEPDFPGSTGEEAAVEDASAPNASAETAESAPSVPFDAAAEEGTTPQDAVIDAPPADEPALTPLDEAVGVGEPLPPDSESEPTSIFDEPFESPSPTEPDDASSPAEFDEGTSFTTEEREAIADQPTVFFEQQAPAELELGDLDLDLDEEIEEVGGAVEAPLTDEEPLIVEETFAAEPTAEAEVAEPPHEVEPEPDPLVEAEPEVAPEPEPAAEPEAADPVTSDFVAPAESDDQETSEEDVLEETPEFLRDNPDDDELWFEQGEPKDFDF